MPRQVISDLNNPATTFSYLPRVAANVQASVASAEIVRWNWVCPQTGWWGCALTGQGSAAGAAGLRYMECRINEAVVGYLEHGFTAADMSQYRTITAGYGLSATALTQGVTYVVRVVNYSGAGNAFYSDANNTFSGIMYLWKGV